MMNEYQPPRQGLKYVLAAAGIAAIFSMAYCTQRGASQPLVGGMTGVRRAPAQSAPPVAGQSVEEVHEHRPTQGPHEHYTTRKDVQHALEMDALRDFSW